MESVGGILKVKKFVNRGFLIGPYCPVYGCGVLLITILLQKYTTDIPALFILSTFICGVLEYFTSYIMEKFFNARWWDYSKNKFNINGRICLETLLPFGIAGSTIICIINPFFVNLLNKIPENVRSIIAYILLIIFFIDCVISFVIINGFKKETYKVGDNTEEISNKVKETTEEVAGKLIEKTEEVAGKVADKTEDVIMKASSDLIVFGRNLKVTGLKLERKVHKYTSKKLSSILKYSPTEFIEKLKYNQKLLQLKIRQDKLELDIKLKKQKENFENKIKTEKENINTKIKETRTNVKNIIKERKETINTKVESIRLSSEEFTKQIVERVREKSIFHKRLVDAFPNLKADRRTKNKEKN